MNPDVTLPAPARAARVKATLVNAATTLAAFLLYRLPVHLGFAAGLVVSGLRDGFRKGIE